MSKLKQFAMSSAKTLLCHQWNIVVKSVTTTKVAPEEFVKHLKEFKDGLGEVDRTENEVAGQCATHY